MNTAKMSLDEVAKVAEEEPTSIPQPSVPAFPLEATSVVFAPGEKGMRLRVVVAPGVEVPFVCSDCFPEEERELLRSIHRRAVVYARAVALEKKE